MKLRCVWDCRILLAAVRKLKGSGMFMSRDKSIGIRRKATMELLKRRAQFDGKQVLLENDRLLIDGIISILFISWLFK